MRDRAQQVRRVAIPSGAREQLETGPRPASRERSSGWLRIESTAVAEIPADVRARLLRDYPGETNFEAMRLVEALHFDARVLRSVVYLAAGDFEQLERLARRAELDWRDVVFWAEYEDHDAEQPRRVRSMDDPLV